MALRRLSPGVYRNTATGGLTRSRTGRIPRTPTPQQPAGNTTNNVTTSTASPAVPEGATLRDGTYMRRGIRVGPGQYKDPVTGKVSRSNDGYIRAEGNAAILARKANVPAVTSETTTGSTETTTGGASPIDDGLNGAPADNSQAQQRIMDLLFPQIDATKVSDSPVFQEQKKQATEELNRRLAAQGLTDSDYANNAAGNVVGTLTSNELIRQQTEADNRASRFNDILNRQQDFQNLQGNQQFDRLYKILSLAASQSPMNAAYDATKNTASTEVDQGNTMSKFLSDLFRRVGSSGGGGGAVPSLPPDLGPDHSGSNSARTAFNFENDNTLNSLFSNLLGNFFNR